MPLCATSGRLTRASGDAHFGRVASVPRTAIGADGEYAVNGRLLVDNQLPTLMRALSEAIGGDTAKHLVINADSDARHQSVVRAMDAAGQLGLIHLSITTRSPDDTR